MIEGITEKDIQALIKIYEDAEREIVAEIQDADFTKRKDKEKMLKQIQNILKKLYDPTQEFITSKSKSEYQSGIQEVQQTLGKLDLKGSFNLIDPKATQFVIETLNDIQDGSFADIKQVLSNSFSNIQSSLNLISREVKNKMASDITNQAVSEIAKGQVLGNSRKEISNQIAQKLIDKGVTGFSYTTDQGKQRNLSLSAYVEGLARSTLIYSRASAVVSQALEMGHDLLKISSHSNESPMCSRWSGQVVSITGKTPGYPRLSDALFSGDYKKGGIFHRYCRHSLTVYVDSTTEFI